MRIVYCLGAMYSRGGTERVLANKVNYLTEVLGHDVHIIIADQKKLPLCFDLSGKVVIHDMEIYKYISKKTLPLVSFFLNAWKLKPIYEEKLKAIQPDIILVLERGYDDLMIPSILPSVPKIRECHTAAEAIKIKDNASKSFKERLSNKIFTKICNIQLKKYHNVVLLTQRDQQYCQNLNNTVVIPNIISKFEGMKAALNNKKAISVGRLDEFKNFRDQIFIWANIVKTYPEWTLHIYGDGPDKGSLQNLINKLGLQNNVFLEGSTRQVGHKYAESSMFLFTSVLEGFGMVLVEAMQIGLPVVSYDCPCGPADIITDQMDGYLVQVGDRALMEKRIVQLIQDKEQRLKIGESGIEKSKVFLPENIIPKWVDLFHQLI